MGGHGGLNILPQKRWNVYNYDNCEKVRRDEEVAAKEEQFKREQSLKRDAESRLEKLRQALGLLSRATMSKAEEEEELRESGSNHMNLFKGIRIFDPVGKIRGEKKEEKKNKRLKEEPVRVVTTDDEKYRLGYGVAGKGVKLPWYMAKPADNFGGATNKGSVQDDDDDDYDSVDLEFGKRKSYGSHNGDGKKKQKNSLEELREERLKRERKENERERVLLGKKSRREDGGNFVHQA